MDIETLEYRVLGLAVEVHKHLGPGLLERTYERCLIEELELNGIVYQSQVPLEIQYKGKALDEGFRLDLLIEERIILELKSVDFVSPLHVAQVLTYLKLSDLHLGYIFNFNRPQLMSGVKRVVNNYEEPII